MLTSITPQSFAAYKALNPQDKRLQQLTLEDLLSKTNGRAVDYNSITYDASLPLLPGAISFTNTGWDCGVGVGYVVFDCVCLFLGATALRDSLNAKYAAAIGEAVEPVTAQLLKYVETIKSSTASRTEVAAAVFGVVSTIYSGGCLSAVLKAFLGSLEWYQSVLYGATALGTIMAALATDGAAEIGLIIVELATAAWIITDSIKCAESCAFN